LRWKSLRHRLRHPSRLVPNSRDIRDGLPANLRIQATSREIHNHIARAVHAGSSIYALDQALLERLNPDVILTQELCDVCAVSYGAVQAAVKRLEGARTLLSLEPTSLTSILETIQQVGDAAEVSDRAAAVVAQLQRRIDETVALVRTASSRPRGLRWKTETSRPPTAPSRRSSRRATGA